jgi:protein-L-isoaspartate(D-aspartate) O-methyltransferase
VPSGQDCLMDDHAIARARMIESQVRTEDVTDRAILKAMGAVPRERFVPATERALAYLDRDVPLGGGRFLMEPAPFARLVQLAEPAPTDRALVVGCGRGYSAAVLSAIVASVVALETDAALAEAARETLATAGAANVTVVRGGSLEAGWAADAPYDLIVVEGSVEFVPQSLLDQLADHGRLVAVVGRGRTGAATLFARSGEDSSERFGFDADVPPLPGFRRAVAFTF